MIKPQKTLLLFILIAAVCVAISFVFPPGGIKITEDWTLEYPSVFELTQEQVDTLPVLSPEEMLLQSSIDSAKIQDSLKTYQLKVQREKQKILWSHSGRNPLSRFMTSLQNHRSVRVLHFGDSQIEGDRITDVFRNYLQRTYGGGGPGSFPIKEFVGRLSIKQNQSSHWQRKVGFIGKDSTVSTNQYGYRGAFDRYELSGDDKDSVWTTWQPWGANFSSQRKIRKMSLWLGQFNANETFSMSIYLNDTLYKRDTIYHKQVDVKRTYPFTQAPKKIHIVYHGPSPAFYAASLEDFSGVTVDNIAMRGSSGTHFTRRNLIQLQKQMQGENVGLIILEYGGNTVPYLDNKRQIEQYARGIQRQINALKKIFPEADFLFIGPADMSKKIKGKLVTYPHLPYLVQQLKKTCFDNEVAFWDLYEVMGGKNSMPLWVASKPPLAGPDHVHFTPQGAREIGKLWVNAFKEMMAEELKRKEEAEQKLKNDSILALNNDTL